jgi:DegV family protein with EDD domain
MTLRIVTDSAADMPSDWQQEYRIDIIPINIHFGEKTFLQGIDINNKGYYQLAEESGTIPKTSQPSPHQFATFYEKIANIGDTILSIHVTSKLSGTFESAVLAAQELKEKYIVIPFDSGAGSAGQGFLCREARILERAGASIQTIMERLEAIRAKIEIVLTLDTLDYARMSGRVKTLQAALASVLNIKPIVILEEGIIYMTDRVRTRRRSLEQILDTMRQRVGEQLVNVAVVHAEDLEVGEVMMEKVRKALNIKDLIMTDLSICLAANLGPGTVGIIAYPVMEG